MTQIRRHVDWLSIRLKQRAAFTGVRFVREYGNDSMETPVRGHIAVVGITKTERKKGYIGGYLSSSVKGETYGAQVEIRVYAPADENGSGLSELVCELMSGLEEADEERVVSDITASSIEFDPDVNAIFRKVEFSMEFCLCEEG